jgi:hypothetical protein
MSLGLESYSALQVLEKLGVDAAMGLGSHEVQVRERIHGLNEMEQGDQVGASLSMNFPECVRTAVLKCPCRAWPVQETLCQKYMDQFKEPLILMLLGSALVSAVMRQYDDAISIAVAVIIVSTVAFIQVCLGSLPHGLFSGRPNRVWGTLNECSKAEAVLFGRVLVAGVSLGEVAGGAGEAGATQGQGAAGRAGPRRDGPGPGAGRCRRRGRRRQVGQAG